MEGKPNEIKVIPLDVREHLIKSDTKANHQSKPMINRPTELKINQPNQPTTNPPTNIMKSNLESLGNGAGVTVPVEVWAQMQQFMATFGPLGTIAPPVAPPLASIAASVTPLAPIAPGLAPIDPVVLALPDMITSQSGPIDPPPAVAPSDSFSDHATESDHSPSDPMALTFNGNEEKDNFSLNEEEESAKEESGSQLGSECSDNSPDCVDKLTAAEVELDEEDAELALHQDPCTEGVPENEGGFTHPVKHTTSSQSNKSTSLSEGNGNCDLYDHRTPQPKNLLVDNDEEALNSCSQNVSLLPILCQGSLTTNGTPPRQKTNEALNHHVNQNIPAVPSNSEQSNSDSSGENIRLQSAGSYHPRLSRATDRESSLPQSPIEDRTHFQPRAPGVEGLSDRMTSASLNFAGTVATPKRPRTNSHDSTTTNPTVNEMDRSCQGRSSRQQSLPRAPSTSPLSSPEPSRQMKPVPQRDRNKSYDSNLGLGNRSLLTNQTHNTNPPCKKTTTKRKPRGRPTVKQLAASSKGTLQSKGGSKKQANSTDSLFGPSRQLAPPSSSAGSGFSVEPNTIPSRSAAEILFKNLPDGALERLDYWETAKNKPADPLRNTKFIANANQGWSRFIATVADIQSILTSERLALTLASLENIDGKSEDALVVVHTYFQDLSAAFNACKNANPLNCHIPKEYFGSNGGMAYFFEYVASAVCALVSSHFNKAETQRTQPFILSKATNEKRTNCLTKGLACLAQLLVIGPGAIFCQPTAQDLCPQWKSSMLLEFGAIAMKIMDGLNLSSPLRTAEFHGFSLNSRLFSPITSNPAMNFQLRL
ncbi:hypothetical protein MJO28_009405 [Puccinia striiformis f. sp. tritici]|uniref:Uncharacterized protein n=1 Tax=Puccinia striiformis f. sp. tritici TaxID=168172 RepID=A0ACC0E8F6_9BASI|nr:hypothetical protein MJO28_009405 [Puccinia striiformis f. sp. tritici]